MNHIRTRFAALPLALLLCIGITQTGCNNTGKGAGIGAGGGAILGGIIGRATGNTARGAIIGAAVGGTAGAVIGRQMDKQAEELDNDLENATVTPIPGNDGNTAGINVQFDNALLFDVGQATLRPGVRADLADLAQSLQNYPGHDAVIVGHASTDGSTATNQSLSERRAEAVRSYLLEQGVASSQHGRRRTAVASPSRSPASRARTRPTAASRSRSTRASSTATRSSKRPLAHGPGLGICARPPTFVVGGRAPFPRGAPGAEALSLPTRRPSWAPPSARRLRRATARRGASSRPRRLARPSPRPRA